MIDRQARLTIPRELGHEREQITAAYFGAMKSGRRDAEPQAHRVKHLVHRGNGRVAVLGDRKSTRLNSSHG